MPRNRTYKWIDGKKIVSTWSQTRCRICNRFLGRNQVKYCSKHKYTVAVRNWLQRHRTHFNTYQNEYYHKQHPEAKYRKK